VIDARNVVGDPMAEERENGIDELPPAEQPGAVALCERCGEHVAQVERIAACVLAHGFERGGNGDHLDDLDLATFAARGLDAPNASEAVEHLSVCHDCREQFSQIRRLLEQHEDLIYGEPPRARMPDRAFTDQVRLVLSDVRRLTRVIVGFLAWMLEWAMLVVLVFQVGGGILASPDAVSQSPATEFLGIAPRDNVRFWAIAAICLTLAVLFRWLGAQLYHSAVEQERH
jgi:hypothetical protein